MPEDQTVPVRALAEQHRRDCEQRVKPATRLVNGLADVVRRELTSETLLAGFVVWISPLGERHAPRVEPRVKDLGDAGGLLAGLGMPDAHPVYVRPVQILRHGDYGKLLQLLNASDHDRL